MTETASTRPELIYDAGLATPDETRATTRDESRAAASSRHLTLTPTTCRVCDGDDAEPVGVGEDFEYRTSPDSFLAVRCRRCGLVYINPRPSDDEIAAIYPEHYHAFDFSAERFGLAYRVRRWLETRRLLGYCRGLEDRARILDVGCGDGFHLDLLRAAGPRTWTLEGVDVDARAADAATRRGLRVHHGLLKPLRLTPSTYDLVLLIATIEHAADPAGLLAEVGSLLRPGGRVVIVTDNTGSPDFAMFKRRHWGGYHFPRHFQLFDARSLRALAGRLGLEVEGAATIVSPVNWVYSMRNALDDWGAPAWLVERFSLRSPAALGVFTLLDMLLQPFGKGALLSVTLRKRPDEQRRSGPAGPGTWPR